tara:strand:+ start:3590 stop:3847 length:258 start_codon:yes stop_codon:yes gene_type:complete
MRKNKIIGNTLSKRSVTNVATVIIKLSITTGILAVAIDNIVEATGTISKLPNSAKNIIISSSVKRSILSTVKATRCNAFTIKAIF